MSEIVNDKMLQQIINYTIDRWGLQDTELLKSKLNAAITPLIELASQLPTIEPVQHDTQPEFVDIYHNGIIRSTLNTRTGIVKFYGKWNKSDFNAVNNTLCNLARSYRIPGIYFEYGIIEYPKKKYLLNAGWTFSDHNNYCRFLFK